MKLLLAVDRSKYSNAALDSVLSCPWLQDTEFLVLAVAETEHERTDYWNPHSRNLLEEAHARLKEELEQLVTAKADQLRARFPNCKVNTQVVEGFVVDKILEIAESWGAELIVLGSHGLKGLTRFLLGSVSEAVASHAHCSVRVVRLGKDKQAQ